MADLTLHEIRPSDEENLEDLLRKEAREMFGPSFRGIDSPPPKGQTPKIRKTRLTFLAPIRKLLRTS